MSIFIHPTALVSNKAKLGDGVWIGPYCIVCDDVEIGSETRLEAFVTVRDHVKIGRKCLLCEHVTLGQLPQDFGYKGELSWVRIGDGVTLRENVTVHRASGEGNETVVSGGCFVMEGVHIGHNVFVGPDCVIASKAGLAGYVSVGKKVVLGGLCGIHQFVRIGDYCMIGGLSKVIKDIPPFLIADGHPAKIRGLNVVGLRRNGFNQQERSLIKEAYKKLLRSSLTLKDALSLLEQEKGNSALIREIIDFIKGSKRGISPWPNKKEKGLEND